MSYNKIDNYFNIDKAKYILSKPAFANKYVVFFAGAGTNTKDLFIATDGVLANTCTLPTFTFNGTEQYVGGVNIVVPIKFEQGQLDMTIYNTGNIWNKINTLASYHYNQKTGIYGYVNDYIIDINVLQALNNGKKMYTHAFKGCTIYTYGGIQFDWDEATSLQTINISFVYRSYKLN